MSRISNLGFIVSLYPSNVMSMWCFRSPSRADQCVDRHHMAHHSLLDSWQPCLQDSKVPSGNRLTYFRFDAF